MIGIEEAYCNTAISALLRANYVLLESTIDDALQHVHVWGKGDTLGVDAKPEIAIAERIRRFDQYAILITEERGEDVNPLSRSAPENERGPRTFFVCDPTDRSSQLKEFLEQHGESSAKVTEAISSDIDHRVWESRYGSPAPITGACSAITCIRRGLPICSALLNYITQEITVACSAGIYHATLPCHKDTNLYDRIDLQYVCLQGRPIYFRQVTPAEATTFVTFMGKRGYRENFLDSKLLRESDIQTCLHYDLPGGPSRILYLSTLQSDDKRIGYIVANGEKISEWIHWLSFVRFGTMQRDLREHALRTFEIFQDRPWTRDGILMSTSPAYSIFKEIGFTPTKMILDVGRLQAFPNPSKYRSTLLTAPTTNDWAMQVVEQYGHRPIDFFGD